MGNSNPYDFRHDSNTRDPLKLIIVKLRCNKHSLLKIARLNNCVGTTHPACPRYLVIDNSEGEMMSREARVKTNVICDFCGSGSKNHKQPTTAKLFNITTNSTVFEVYYGCERYFSISCLLAPYHEIYPSIVCGHSDDHSLFHNLPSEIINHIISIAIRYCWRLSPNV